MIIFIKALTFQSNDRNISIFFTVFYDDQS